MTTWLFGHWGVPYRKNTAYRLVGMRGLRPELPQSESPEMLEMQNGTGSPLDYSQPPCMPGARNNSPSGGCDF